MHYQIKREGKEVMRLECGVIELDSHFHFWKVRDLSGRQIAVLSVPPGEHLEVLAVEVAKGQRA